MYRNVSSRPNFFFALPHQKSLAPPSEKVGWLRAWHRSPQGRSQKGDMGECAPGQIIIDMTLLWYRAGKTKGKCAISTLIFRNISVGYAPRHAYWGGVTAPIPMHTPPPSRLFGLSIVVSPPIKMLATLLGADLWKYGVGVWRYDEVYSRTQNILEIGNYYRSFACELLAGEGVVAG